jgi:hypothetical protein
MAVMTARRRQAGRIEVNNFLSQDTLSLFRLKLIRLIYEKQLKSREKAFKPWPVPAVAPQRASAR